MFVNEKAKFMFSASSRTFSLMTLKFHCLGSLLFQLEFFFFGNCFIFFSIIHSGLQPAVSLLQCSCWFLCCLIPCENSIVSAAHWCWYCRYCCTFSFNRITHDTKYFWEQLFSWIWLQMRCRHVGSEIRSIIICV